MERLWRPPTTGDGAQLVAQSRIPVEFDPELDRWDGEAGELAADDEAPQPVKTAALPTARP